MRVNEIFYSLQGEGYFTGRAAVFVRFSGCNERCPFCDTRHESFTEMSENEIVAAVKSYPSRHIVLTGGEPSLQITESLLALLHADGWFIQVETNGTHSLPESVDWITYSPKSTPGVLKHADEIKVVYQGDDKAIDDYSVFDADVFSLQPCDYGDKERNAAIISGAVHYVKSHPRWRLSLQTHKFINIP